MTKIEIISETVEFYSADTSRRSFVMKGSTTQCVYNAGDDRHCAVGRCMTEELKSQGVDLENNSEPLEGVMENYSEVDELLEQKYHGHSLKFWRDLQSFHDQNDNWDKKGVSIYGKMSLIRLKGEYATS
jgi:hypothetical protein